MVTGGLDFDGVDDFLSLAAFSSGSISQPFSMFVAAKSNASDANQKIVSGSSNIFIGTSPSFDGRYNIRGGGTIIEGSTTSDTNYHILTALFNTTDELFLDGSSELSGDSGSSSLSTLYLGQQDNGFNQFDGITGEIIIYNTDQSDNRTALEANIGEVYGIAGIPAYDNTVNGFVETWYDQSGNGNNATQLTAAYQPKIVNAGALVQDGSNASLKFDGVNDYLVTTQGYIVEISQNPASVFAVANPDAIGEGYLLTEGDSVGTYSSSFILNGAASGSATAWINNTEFGSGFPASLTLGGFIYNGTNFQAYLNGAADGSSGTAPTLAETSLQSYIATRADGTTSFFGGNVSEIITYKSDQTANRPAIDANIINHYDI